MPLTKEGQKTLRSMQKTYGKDKGESVFYAWLNKNKKGKAGAKFHKKRKKASA